MVNELTGCSTSRSNTQTVYYIVKTTLELLKQSLTGHAIGTGCFFEEDTELSLENTICILCLLLLCELCAVLRSLTTTIIAMLARREVSIA